jgi:transcriptional regulator with XRE-family HTH domain
MAAEIQRLELLLGALDQDSGLSGMRRDQLNADLARLGTEEAWRALLPRYNFTVDPTITDREEKAYILEAISKGGDAAVGPVKEYLLKANAVNWPIKMLRALVSEEEFVGEMAAILKIAPTHLSDIETGKRTPSDEVIGRICKQYEISEVALRAGWSRPFSAVATIASQDATTIEKVPEFLTAAKSLSPAQWDSLIEAAHRLTGKPKGGAG